MEDAEDNVVGTLFLQNGEESDYHPEDWVQDVDVGPTALNFRISLAEDDGGIPGSLFACALWTGARFIAMHFARHPELVKGRSLVEFGAASALPSLVGLHFGASVAVMTDYPNDILLKNIETNIKRNKDLIGDGKHAVKGHLWGSDTAGLLKCLEVDSAPETAETEARKVEVTKEAKFDVAIVAECLWLHHLHEDLLKSIDSCLVPGGKAFVSFAHHIPGCEEEDLSFFTKAKKLFGYDSVHLDTLVSPHIFNADRLVEQYLYVLTKPASPADNEPLNDAD